MRKSEKKRKRESPTFNAAGTLSVAEVEAKVRRMRASGARQSVALDSASRFVEAGDTDLSALFGGLRNSGGGQLLP